MLEILVSQPALAEEPNVSRAEELFRQGKALLGERDYARACPLLATSYDLDPGTGVLLALAICHEGDGKLASASTEYKLAAERSAAEGRADRERVARDRALALEPRLSTLAIVPPTEARGSDDFVVRRSGVVLERDAWDTPVPLDGGEYVVEASRAGRRTWRSNVALAQSGDHRTVTIPALEAIEPAAVAPTTPRPSTDAQKGAAARDDAKPKKASTSLTPLQIVGIGAMGAGAVGLGLGTVYAFRALDRYKESNQNGCNGDVCEGQGKTDRQAARSAGDAATVSFAVGATLAAGGALTFLLGSPSDGADAASEPPLRGRVSMTDGGLMLTLGGRL